MRFSNKSRTRTIKKKKLVSKCSNMPTSQINATGTSGDIAGISPLNKILNNRDTA